MTQADIVHLNAGTAPQWLESVRRCVDYDVYHLPFYHLLPSPVDKGTPVLFRYEEDDTLICLPMVIRSIESVGGLEECGKGYRDATSVYGYAGPIASKQSIGDNTRDRFQKSLRTTLSDLRVVSLFSRMHPLFENASLATGAGKVVVEGPTVSIDTTLPPDVQPRFYRRNHAKDIAALRALGAVCSQASRTDDVRAFIRIYNEAMLRVRAPEGYFFPDSWYDAVLSTGESRNALFLCSLGSKPMCGALVTTCNGIAEMHLAATANDCVCLSPLKLLFDYVRDWATGQGMRALHLGGGVGARKDSLFQFKSGFSPRQHIFHTWQWEIDPQVCQSLTREYIRYTQSNSIATVDRFFPAYRAPLRTAAGLKTTEKRREETEMSTRHRATMGDSRPAGEDARVSGGVEVEEQPKRVVVIGAGAHARVVADAILSRANRTRKVELLGFLDDDPALVDKQILGKPVFGPARLLEKVPHDALVMGIADNYVRRKLFQELAARGERFVTVIHPQATMASDVTMGIGSVVLAGVVVESGTTIGNNVILNAGSTIGADCIVKSHAHICPTAYVAPGMMVEEGVLIGVGSSMPQSSTIGEGFARQPVVIYGAGGLGREVLVAMRSPAYQSTCDVRCFVDDNPDLNGKTIDGIPVLTPDKAVREFEGCSCLCAVAEPAARQRAVEKGRSLGMQFISFVHDRAIVPPGTRIGDGCIVSAGCILTANVVLGDFSILNLQATLGHDVTVGNFSTIGPGVRVGGFVRFGEKTFVGMGAMVVNGTETHPIVIGEKAHIGAGSCVLHSIPAGQTVFGSPARPVPLPAHPTNEKPLTTQSKAVDRTAGMTEKPKKTMNILFTCAGRRNYLVEYFRQALNGRGIIVAADMHSTAPAMAAADKAFVVPAVYAPDYVRTILEICHAEKITALFSLNDLELPLMAAAREQFEREGVTLVLSSADVIDTCGDKWKTCQFASAHGINVPMTYLSLDEAKAAIAKNELSFPLVVKPRWGSASIGLEFPEDAKELDLAYQLLDLRLSRTILAEVSKNDAERAILIQEKIDGKEFGLDVLNDLTGKPVQVFVKEKLAMRAGETDKAILRNIPELSDLGFSIGRSLGHVGNLDCDVFEREGRYYLLEMNPRFGGGYPFSQTTGGRFPDAIVAWLEGRTFDFDEISRKYDVPYAKCDTIVDVSRP